MLQVCRRFQASLFLNSPLKQIPPETPETLSKSPLANANGIVIGIAVDAPPGVHSSRSKRINNKESLREELRAELCGHEPAGAAVKTTRSVRQVAGHIFP